MKKILFVCFLHICVCLLQVQFCQPSVRRVHFVETVLGVWESCRDVPALEGSCSDVPALEGSCRDVPALEGGMYSRD
jgi:hypothetical protein